MRLATSCVCPGPASLPTSIHACASPSPFPIPAPPRPSRTPAPSLQPSRPCALTQSSRQRKGVDRHWFPRTHGQVCRTPAGSTAALPLLTMPGRGSLLMAAASHPRNQGLGCLGRVREEDKPPLCWSSPLSVSRVCVRHGCGARSSGTCEA